MIKRVAAPETAKSSVASKIPLSGSGEERTARRVEGVARKRRTADLTAVCVDPGVRSVDRRHVFCSGKGRASRGAAMVALWSCLLVEQRHVLGSGKGRASRDAVVGARERLPMR